MPRVASELESERGSGPEREKTSLSVAYLGPPVTRPASRVIWRPPPFCLFEVGCLATLGRPVVAEVVDLDVLPGLVAGVAAELVVIGPHRARVVVVASDHEGKLFLASYEWYFGNGTKRRPT